MSDTPARIHPTAIIDDGVSIGSGTAVWDTVHLRAGARVGRDCIIGEKTYMAPDVVVGDRCKINGFVYVCRGVTIEDAVMIGANVTFTNDRFPPRQRPSSTHSDRATCETTRCAPSSAKERQSARGPPSATISCSGASPWSVWEASSRTASPTSPSLPATQRAHSATCVAAVRPSTAEDGGLLCRTRARVLRADAVTNGTMAPEDYASTPVHDDAGSGPTWSSRRWPGRSSGATRTQWVPR